MHWKQTILLLLLIILNVVSKALFAQNDPQPTNYNDFILKKGENAKDKIDKNLFIKVYTDKISCYVGEPVLATYKLYTRLHSTSNTIKTPSFTGFSVIDLVQPEWGTSHTIENLGGRDYYIYIIRKAQLYPSQPGAAELQAATVENKIRFVKGEYLTQTSGSDSPEFLPGTKKADAILDTTVIIESKPVSINVKPLPGNGKPVSFNGAVGNFMIDALVEKDSLTSDDAGRLRILLSGEGNITLVAAPEVPWPNGIEGFEPAVKDGLNKLSIPVSGSKIFDYSFTVAKEGDYTIAPVAFSFFDLTSGRYKTVSTKPVTVHIAKGTGKRPAIAVVDNRGRQERFADAIFTHRWMIIVPVALLIIICLLLWLRMDKKREQEKLIAAALQKEEENIVEEKIPVNPLAQSELLLFTNAPRQFYETLDKELHIFLANKLKLPAEAISKRTIAEALDKSGINIADSIAIQQLLDDIAMQLYTPFADENKMQDHYVEAMRLIKRVGAN